LSTTINKYSYIGINPKFDDQIRISYLETENVPDRNQVKHPLVKAALGETGIEGGLEIISVSDIPGKGTGLGSSSSFTVGLINALYSYLGKQLLPPPELAEKACQIEINKVGSPIGKQDQYAAAFGGLNVITFKTDGKIEVESVYLPPKLKEDFQNHLLMFYTGVQRTAKPILSEQKENIDKKFEFLKQLSNLVLPFRDALEKGDFKKMGEILNQNWQMKKELSSGISNPQIEKMYNLALSAGAFGGKILGAGGGGFLLVIAPPENHQKIKEVLKEYRLSSFRFTEAGSKIIFKG
jgi:D-glycero-alpha-D-manno-heptose-7-phosphate kinase